MVLSITVEAAEVEPDDEPYGEITDISVLDSELGHPLVEGCMVNVLGDLRFSSPGSGMSRITYPFVFRSSSTE